MGIGGRTKSYLCIGWGLPFLGLGTNIYVHILQMGNDPRCMVGWDAEVKMAFFLSVIALSAISVVLMTIVHCNVKAPALRKASFVENQGSIAKAFLTFVTLFALTWSWTPFSYINFESVEVPNFYPAFQIMNSWMGAFYFLIVGVGSKQFRSVITGNVLKRKQQLIDAKASLQKE